jgi:hypothetical protein
MQVSGEYNQYIYCPNTSKCEQASMHKKEKIPSKALAHS